MIVRYLNVILSTNSTFGVAMVKLLKKEKYIYVAELPDKHTFTPICYNLTICRLTITQSNNICPWQNELKHHALVKCMRNATKQEHIGFIIHITKCMGSSRHWMHSYKGLYEKKYKKNYISHCKFHKASTIFFT